MKDLLDTNIVSELGKPKPHGAVMAWFHSQLLVDLAIPSVAIYEMQIGAERARKQHPARAAELDAAIAKLMRAITVLPFDGDAARETARMIHGKSLDLLEDAMIAAIAKVNGLRIITRNTKDFVHFDVPHFDPFGSRKP